MQPIDVRPSAAYLSSNRRLKLMFIGMGVLFLLLALRGESGGLFFAALMFGGGPLAVLAWSSRVWALRFDGAGVTLKSGQVLPWSGFQRVVTVTTPGGAGVKRYELVFQGARARVFPMATENRAEVEGFVVGLSRGANPLAPALR